MTEDMNHIDDIKTLLFKINPICAKAKQAEEEKRKRGECFNVFNTLGLRSEEVRLHSAFLAELLNPDGSHGMGNDFFRQFLSEVIKEERSDFIQSDKVNQNIVERSIGQRTEDEGGILDIIIEDGNHAVIIENKIYARDQEHQLLRYDNFGKKHFPNPRDYHLVYLTLDGHEASDLSTGGHNIAYSPISYSKDILAWLHACVRLAYDKPLVRETIKQYIHLIKQLTNQTMETEYRKEIVALAVDNLEAVVALTEAGTEISTRLREKYIYPQLEQFAEENALEIDIYPENIIFKKAVWEHTILITSNNNIPWSKVFIGIVSVKEERLQENLNSLKDIPTKNYYPFGIEYLPWEDWISPSNFLAIKNGEVVEWIKKKVSAILQEIEEKHILI